MARKTNENMIKITHLAILVLTALIILHMTCNNGGGRVHLEQQQVLLQEGPITGNHHETESLPASCDLFSGRWVYDDVSYPLYKERECSFMTSDFACERYGRKNLEYQNWRWQPYHCDLPRFNGTALLEKLRGKRLIFVGDSMNRNQWRSMLCLVHSYLHASTNKSLELDGNLQYFHTIEYNATIGFYWEPMLVESRGDNVSAHSTYFRVVRVQSIEKHARYWIDADILVFDSFTWWMAPDTITILWGSFNSPNAIRKTVDDNLRVYEMALNTWSDFLEMNISPTKTKIFFMSAPPYRPGTNMWGTNDSCYGQTKPNFNNATYWASAAKRDMMRVTESTVDKLKERGVNIEYLNITELSACREDAHPATNRVFGRRVSKDEMKSLSEFTDCLHWCLPGVPDIWNHILYTYIMKS